VARVRALVEQRESGWGKESGNELVRAWVEVSG